MIRCSVLGVARANPSRRIGRVLNSGEPPRSTSRASVQPVRSPRCRAARPAADRPRRSAASRSPCSPVRHPPAVRRRVPAVRVRDQPAPSTSTSSCVVTPSASVANSVTAGVGDRVDGQWVPCAANPCPSSRTACSAPAVSVRLQKSDLGMVADVTPAGRRRQRMHERRPGAWAPGRRRGMLTGSVGTRRRPPAEALPVVTRPVVADPTLGAEPAPPVGGTRLTVAEPALPGVLLAPGVPVTETLLTPVAEAPVAVTPVGLYAIAVAPVAAGPVAVPTVTGGARAVAAGRHSVDRRSPGRRWGGGCSSGRRWAGRRTRAHCWGARCSPGRQRDSGCPGHRCNPGCRGRRCNRGCPGCRRSPGCRGCRRSCGSPGRRSGAGGRRADAARARRDRTGTPLGSRAPVSSASAASPTRTRVSAGSTPAFSSIASVVRRCLGSTSVATAPDSPARAVRPARCR